jgi:peptidyl-prolyl cis-trans isomerase C
MLPMPRLSAIRQARALPAVALALVLVLSVGALGGCGAKEKQDKDDSVLLATVGDREIRASDYEASLGRLELTKLPRGKDGRPLDMATQEAKEEFLTTLIHKNLMEIKGRQLGYGDSPAIKEAIGTYHSYEAGLALWRNVVGEPSSEITHEEMDAFYALVGQKRQIAFFITDFESQANKALEELRAGADWNEIALAYHAGDIPPEGVAGMKQIIPFGRYDGDFEAAIFSTDLNQFAGPIETEYGWWVFKVLDIKEGSKPSRDEALADLLDLARKRKIVKLKNAFRDEIHAKYKVVVEDEALVKAFAGLPSDEGLLDPATNRPVPQDNLLPLEIAPADMDLPFYSYEIDGQARRYTLGEYKIRFDRMNTFQRPKKAGMMGSLRGSIVGEIDKAILDAEARERGMYEEADVVFAVDNKASEMIVTAMYGDLIVVDETISSEAMDAAFEENRESLATPEKRTGKALVAATREKAAEARDKALAGADWADLIRDYDVDQANTAQGGQLPEVSSQNFGPVYDALFATPLDGICEPVYLADADRWVILRVDRIIPTQPAVREEVSSTLSQLIIAGRKEALLTKLLNEWSEELGVVRHDENLAQVKSWKELTHVEPTGPKVPRS